MLYVLYLKDAYRSRVKNRAVFNFIRAFSDEAAAVRFGTTSQFIIRTFPLGTTNFPWRVTL